MIYRLSPRRPKHSGRYTIGLIAENSGQEDENVMRLGVIEAAERLGVNLICFTHLEALIRSGTYGSNEAYRPSHDQLQRLIEEFELDGLLFLGWSRLYDGEELQRFRERFADIPILSLGKTFGDVPSTFFYGGAYIEEMLEHLIRDHGRRRIAFVASWVADARSESYTRIMHAHGLFDPSLFITTEDLSGVVLSDRPDRAISMLIDERGVSFDALMVMRMEEAKRILALLEARGLRVPEDVALVCYEDDLSIRYTSPPITTIEFPFREIGYAGLEQLVKLLTTGEIPLSIPIPGRLIYRRSCGCGEPELPAAPAAGRRETAAASAMPPRGQEHEREMAWLAGEIIQTKRVNQLLEEFSQSVLNLFDVPDILDMLEYYLGALGVRRCDIFLRDDSESRFGAVNHLYAFAEKRRIGTTDGAIATRRYYRKKTSQADGPTMRVVSLLHAEKNYIGFVDFEMGPRDGAVYLRLAIALSNAFVGTMTVNRLRQEIALRMEKEAQLSYFAHYDMTTGLLNRHSFYDGLRALNPADPYYLFYIDLDGFKSVNDSLGHGAGDRLLEEIAGRIRDVLGDKLVPLPRSFLTRDDRTVYGLFRIGGDEFTAAIRAYGQQEAAAAAEQLVERLGMPYDLAGTKTELSCSIGISAYPHDASRVTELIRYADMAMYHAKKRGGSRSLFFDADMEREHQERLELSRYLRHAIDYGELELHYQPQVESQSGLVVGVEALLRWNHPTIGRVPPSTFIPLAEEMGLIGMIGDWVLREACRQMAEWMSDGIAPLRMAVNLSAKQLLDGKLAEQVFELLDETGIAPAQLELEITENVALREEHMLVLHRLRERGIELAIDDFGTYYSSLSYLKRFPVTKLKLDQSFVRGIVSEQKDREMIKAIISVAAAFELEVIAEGVETAEEAEFLVRQGCDYIQGYYYYKPMPPAEVRAVLAECRPQPKERQQG